MRGGQAAAGPAFRLLRQRRTHPDEPLPGGTRAQLAHIGIRVVRILEAFTTGMPTEEEVAALRIGGAIPVLRFTRRHVADDGRVVEVAHPIVRRGDATLVEFAVELDD